MGWLVKTRVQHVPTGALGTVVEAGYWYSGEILVDWDHGARMKVLGSSVQRSPDDWFARAVNSGEQM